MKTGSHRKNRVEMLSVKDFTIQIMMISSTMEEINELEDHLEEFTFTEKYLKTENVEVKI